MQEARTSTFTRILILCAVMAMATTAAFAQGGVNGGVYTSDVTGTIVNQNIYTSKDDVYLNGGPQGNCGSALGPDGTYYFEVTNTSGNTVLSDDAASNRIITVVNGTIVAHSGSHAKPANGSCGINIQLKGFDTSANGEYKTSVILIAGSYVTKKGALVNVESDVTVDPDDPRILHYNNKWSKSDNFKVKEVPVDPCAGGVISQACPPKNWPLEGRKFYDANKNGVWDTNELPLAGWQIRGIGDSPMIDPNQGTANMGSFYTAVVATDATGKFAFSKLTVGGVYGVAEILPPGPWFATAPRPTNGLGLGESLGGATWESQIFCPRHVAPVSVLDLSTAPFTNASLNALSCLSNLNNAGYSSSPYFSLNLGGVFNGGANLGANLVPGRGPVDFGNYCTGPGREQTIGGWSNKNGQALIGEDDLLMLRNLNLKSATGVDFNPTTYAQLRTWLLGATATNMAYMLSAQLATTELNVFNGIQNGTFTVYVPGALGADGNGFITINKLMTEANKSLADNPNTTSGDAFRIYQAALKTALDDINNNRIVLGPGSCPTYTFNEGQLLQDAAPADVTNIQNSISDLVNVTLGAE